MLTYSKMSVLLQRRVEAAHMEVDAECQLAKHEAMRLAKELENSQRNHEDVLAMLTSERMARQTLAAKLKDTEVCFLTFSEISQLLIEIFQYVLGREEGKGTQKEQYKL